VPKADDWALEKGLPVNLDAERYVLGSVLIDDSLFAQVAGVIQADDFSLEKHRRIFGRMTELHERGERIDRITLANELMKHGQLESCDGLGYLVSLDDGLPRISNLESYVRIVRDKAVLRRAICACQRTIHRCCGALDDPAALLDQAERLLREIGESVQVTGHLRAPAQIIEEYPGGLNAFMQPASGGIKTPWPGVNRLITGLRPPQLVVIAARPGVGKSAAACQIADKAASAGAGVVIFSLEMGADEILQRMACARGGVDSQKFRQGKLDQTERLQLQRALSQIAELPLWIDDKTGITVPALEAAIRRQRVRHKIDLVIVDYLQLMQNLGRHERRVEEITQITRGLKLAAKGFNAPFLVLAQLNRASENERRRPVLSDLRESGSTEQDSDVVIFIHQPEMQKGGSPGMAGLAEFIIAKQRNGPRGKVDLQFNDRLCRFEERADVQDQEAHTTYESSGGRVQDARGRHGWTES